MSVTSEAFKVWQGQMLRQYVNNVGMSLFAKGPKPNIRICRGAWCCSTLPRGQGRSWGDTPAEAYSNWAQFGDSR